MKRKLPSQRQKFEEELLKQPEASNTTAPPPEETPSAEDGAQNAAPSTPMPETPEKPYTEEALSTELPTDLENTTEASTEENLEPEEDTPPAFKETVFTDPFAEAIPPASIPDASGPDASGEPTATEEAFKNAVLEEAAEVSETLPSSFTEDDTQTATSHQPQPEAPEAPEDTFVGIMPDEDTMTLDAPPARPSKLEDMGGPALTHPRRRPVSTQALLETFTPAPTPSPEELAAKMAEQQEKEEAEGQKEEGLNDLFEETQPPSTAETAPLEEEEEDAWDLNDLIQVPQDTQHIGQSPFKEEAPVKDADSEPTPPADAAPSAPPPWQKKPLFSEPKAKEKSGRKKTILPNIVAENPSRTGAIASVALVALLVGGTFLFYQNREVAVEKISRWTGTLNEVGQPVPPTTFEAAQPTKTPEALQAEAVVEVATLPQQPAPNPQSTENSNISLEVLDVPPEEAQKPIVADGSVDIPDELDKFSALQEAIARKRSEKREKEAAKLAGDPEGLDPATLPPEEITRRNLEIIRQTNESLEEYKKALTKVHDPALKPRPGAFLEQKRQAAAGLLPPPETGATQTATPQMPELYGNMVVDDLAELVAQSPQEDGIRKLEDFEVDLFDHTRPRVSIPKGLVPRLSAEDFPPLEVISFVANQGLIAKAHGKEGILLLGETLEGWELVAVQNSYAEFQKDGKKRIVTFKNANR